MIVITDHARNSVVLQTAFIIFTEWSGPAKVRPTYILLVTFGTWMYRWNSMVFGKCDNCL